MLQFAMTIIFNKKLTMTSHRRIMYKPDLSSKLIYYFSRTKLGWAEIKTVHTYITFIICKFKSNC